MCMNTAGQKSIWQILLVWHWYNASESYALGRLAQILAMQVTPQTPINIS